MHVNQLLGYKRSPHAVRCPAEDAHPPARPRVVTMAKLTYIRLNTPTACPPRTACLVADDVE